VVDDAGREGARRRTPSCLKAPRALASVGDERNALLMLTVEADFGEARRTLQLPEVVTARRRYV